MSTQLEDEHGDRWGPVWHTSDTALAQTDGSWITEGTGGRQAEEKTEPANGVCMQKGGPA